METYGVAVDGRVADGRIEVHPPSEVYRGDDYVYWGFGAGGLSALATHAGFSRVTIDATPTIDSGTRASSPRSSGPAPDQAASEDAAVRTRAGREGGRSSPAHSKVMYRIEVVPRLARPSWRWITSSWHALARELDGMRMAARGGAG